MRRSPVVGRQRRALSGVQVALGGLEVGAPLLAGAAYLLLHLEADPVAGRRRQRRGVRRGRGEAALTTVSRSTTSANAGAVDGRRRRRARGSSCAEVGDHELRPEPRRARRGGGALEVARAVPAGRRASARSGVQLGAPARRGVRADAQQRRPAAPGSSDGQPADGEPARPGPWSQPTDPIVRGPSAGSAPSAP